MKNISYQPNLQEKTRKNETVVCVSFKFKDTEIQENKVCHEPITCVVRKKESKKIITREDGGEYTYKSLERATTPGESKGGLIINYWAKMILVVVIMSDPFLNLKKNQLILSTI